MTDPDLQNVLELKVSKKETFANLFYKMNICKVLARYDAFTSSEVGVREVWSMARTEWAEPDLKARYRVTESHVAHFHE